jgi:hypothetical protein
MTSAPGVPRQDTDYARHRQEALHELHQLQQTPRLVTRPDAREALAHEMRQRPARLGSLLVGPHLPQALDSAALQAAHEQLGQPWPPPLKNDGRAKVGMRTAPGLVVSVWVPYDRRKGQRGAGTRDAGVYPGLVLWGIDDRGPPALAAEVRWRAAMLGALDEVQAVLADRGVAFDTQTVRLIAYR